MIFLVISAFALWVPLAFICWLLDRLLNILKEARDYLADMLDTINESTAK